MKNLIEAIRDGSTLEINNNKYIAIAKAFYVTESNLTDWYAKVFLKNHYALVLSPSDNFLYFGKDVGSLPYDFPTPNKINYSNLIFTKIAEDYQIVKTVEFGSLIDTEGEVKFIDYKCESNENKIISVGLIVRLQKRADIIADVLKLQDIKLV